ncbi:NAD(P)H-dependent oxidoreductase [Chitinimonas sp.]|uniref:NAD(P)H-dependent oxidoreductase n=1 Tax=Chitinimonas sp. TaxID=1934313 RepID=UPI0035B0067F
MAHWYAVAESLKQLLIVQAGETASGRSARLAQAALAGAQAEAAVRSVLLHALQAGIDDLLAADALLLITPEKFGYMAGALKDFFDRTFYPAQGKVEGLPYALMVVAGNDGRGAISSVERIVRGYPFKPVAKPWLLQGESGDAELDTARQLGLALASGVACGIF